MKRQEHTGTADEFAAEAHQLLGQRDGQDTADYAAAVAAAIKAASVGGNRRKSPRPGSSRRDCPSPGYRASARCPDPNLPRSPATRWPGFRMPARPGH